MDNHISWNDFEKVDIRVGTIIEVDEFSEARKPAWKLTVDFGNEIGVRKSSAQITDLYQREDLINSQVMAVINFPPKQIATFMSECLVLGIVGHDEGVVLLRPDKPVANGLRMA